MGSIQIFSLTEYIEKFKCKTYVETGTGAAECLTHAVTFPFEKYYTIDIDGELIEKAEATFNNPKITFIHNYSSEALKELVPTLPKDEPVLFFLDAHFPGADFHFETYTSTEDYHTRLPLEREVRNLVNLRDTSNDVIIIDDLRVYEDNNYSDGNWPLRSQAGGNGVEFIYELFGQTHIIEKDLRFQGFLIITPNKSI
jgi:hypothetical protein